MPNPTQSDLHVNVPLTNVSIAYLQSANTYIADKVFPKVPVQKQSDLYWKYSKSDWRRTQVTKRAPATETPGDGWNNDTDQYFCHVYGIHKDIDDQLRANADSNFNLDRDSTEFITNQLLLKRDIDWNAAFFTNGKWATDLDGDNDFTKWTETGSDPISDVANWIIDFRKLTGYSPNVMVLGAHVMAALKQHPDIIDRIKYTGRDVVTTELLAALFDVQRVHVGNAIYSNDAGTAFTDVWGKFVVVAYTELGSMADMGAPSYGYTYNLNGYPLVEEPYYERNPKSWIYPVTRAEAPVLASASAGYLITTAVA